MTSTFSMLALAWLSLLFILNACTSASTTVTEYQYEPRAGTVRETGTMTEEESWKRGIESDIERQVANGPLYCGGISTWEACWRDKYERLRKFDAPFSGPSELKTAEDRVAYIKSRLIAHGLPTYD